MSEAKRVGAGRAGTVEMRELFSEAGLTMPPVPEELSGRFRKRGKWLFASRAVRTPPYAIEKYVQRSRGTSVRDFVLVAHDGHGANSYAIHYYVVRGALRLFVQVGWGGVYMDPKESSQMVNRVFELCHELLDALNASVAFSRRSGPVFVVGSDLYPDIADWPGSTGSPLLDDKGSDQRRGNGTPLEVLRRAVEWAKGEK